MSEAQIFVCGRVKTMQDAQPAGSVLSCVWCGAVVSSDRMITVKRQIELMGKHECQTETT